MKQKKIINIIALFIPVLCFSFYLVHQLFTDLWNDEIYTLKYFAFVPLFRTVTDCHVPNNHIFFNVINNLYLRAVGIKDLYELMDNAWLIRMLPLVYSGFSILLIFKIARKFISESSAFL